MKFNHSSNKRAIAAGLLCALLCMCLSCGLGPIVDNGTSKARQIVEEAVAKLENQSLDWQAVVKETQAKLTNDINETIRNEISNTLQRALQAGSIQFACGVDFVRKSLKQD